MKKQTKKAFTLVELIVVIIILAILWTIAFISLQWYSKSARDSTRISNLSTMKTSLELFHLDAWKYPLPTDSFTVTYNWTEVWTQWTFWTTTANNIDKLDKIPTDPLTAKEFTYSITKTKQEFQLAWMFETTDLVLNNTLSQTKAWDTIATALVTWNYNWALSKINTWTTCEILSIPSIISSQPETTTDLSTILTNKWLVFNWFNNLPNNYQSSKYNNEWWFDFTSNQLIVYSDTESCEPLYDADDNTARTTLITNLQTAYSWTIISNKDYINNITSLDINNANDVDLFWKTLVNNNMWGDIALKNSNWEGWSSWWETWSSFTTDYLNSTFWDSFDINDSWNVDTLKEMFAANSIYAKNWNSYGWCTISDVQELTNISWWINLVDNTIYILDFDSVDITSQINFNWNCIAMISKKAWWSTFVNNNTTWSADYGLLQISSRSNIILDNITLNWNNSTRKKRGIYFDWSSSSTLHNISSYNNETSWIYIFNWQYINFENIRTYNNYGGITLQSTVDYNIFNNLIVYNNSAHWLWVAGADYNSFNNIQLFNNGSYNLVLTQWSLNSLINGIYAYNGSSYGIYANGNSNNAILRNHYNFNNNISIDLSTTWNKYYDTLKVFWNSSEWTYPSQWLSTDTPKPTTWLDWALDQTVETFNASWVVQPSVTWWDYTLRWYQTWLTFDWSETYTFWANISKQTKPVKWNWSAFEEYGVDGVDYDSTKYIWEW